MSTKKKKKQTRRASVPPYLKAVIQFGLGPGRTLLMSLLVIGLFVVAWRGTWLVVRDDVVSAPQYWITPDRVEITPPPQWIHTDIREEAFRDASLDKPLSILDRDLVERIARAFSLHPWVAEVRRVRKLHPARLEVDLAYRQPVCMVVVPDGMHPVDIEGVLLPAAHFPPVEALRYPRLRGVETTPTSPGTRWRDVRVVEGAEIAAAFGSVWNELRLDHIEPYMEPNSESAGDFSYLLFTSSGSRIHWGRAPGNCMPGEATASEKIALLQDYFQKHGTLDGPNESGSLDIRDIRGNLHSASKVKESLR